MAGWDAEYHIPSRLTADFGEEEAEWHIGGPIWGERKVRRKQRDVFLISHGTGSPRIGYRLMATKGRKRRSAEFDTEWLKFGRLCPLMGQGQQLGSERCTTSSGACVLCVLNRHLMGSAGCGAARLKSQSVEGSAACYSIGAIIRSLPRASLPLGSSFRPPVLVGADRLRRFELGAVPKHGMHDNGGRRASAIRALRMVDRFAMANAQSFSFSAPL